MSNKVKRWAVVATVSLLALILLAGIYVERVDDAFIISTKTRVIDPVGEIKLAYTRATRDCSLIQIAEHSSMIVALNASNLNAQLNAQNPKPRAGWKQGEWLLIESDFENLEPAWVLLKQHADQYEVAALYSGTAAPFNDVQFIHQYFSQQRKDVPKQLVNCYEPVGAPFDRTS